MSNINHFSIYKQAVLCNANEEKDDDNVKISKSSTELKV